MRGCVPRYKGPQRETLDDAKLTEIQWNSDIWAILLLPCHITAPALPLTAPAHLHYRPCPPTSGYLFAVYLALLSIGFVFLSCLAYFVFNLSFYCLTEFSKCWRTFWIGCGTKKNCLSCVQTADWCDVELLDVRLVKQMNWQIWKKNVPFILHWGIERIDNFIFKILNKH